VTFTASDGDKSYSLSSTKDVTITVRDVTVAEQLTGLTSAVAATSLNGGNKNALTVKLNQVAKQLAKGKADDAVRILTEDFIPQVADFLAAGKLTADEAEALTTAAQEAVLNITS